MRKCNHTSASTCITVFSHVFNDDMCTKEKFRDTSPAMVDHCGLAV
jgi:hypothetical protein